MLAKPLQKTALAGLCMAGALALLQAVAPTLNGKGLILEVGGLLSELGIGTAVFFGVAAFLRSDEIQLLRGLFQRWRT
jgi:hypothetical protein